MGVANLMEDCNICIFYHYMIKKYGKYVKNYSMISSFLHKMNIFNVAGCGRCHSGPSGPGETHRDTAGGNRFLEEDP